MQYFSMCLWRVPEDSDTAFDEIAQMTYNVLTVFKILPKKFQPNYITVKKKKDAKSFDWNYENFYCYLKSKINKSGNIFFEDLGYNISFFSSLINRESFGYSMSVGIKNPLFVNTLIVNISSELNLFEEKNAKLICEVFTEIVEKFKPFWGAIINDSLNRGRNCFPITKEKEILSIHWMNYFSDDFFTNIEKERLTNIDKIFPKASFENGILRLQEKPINADIDEDIQYKKMIEKYLLKLGESVPEE